ncbi:MAG: glutaredoxin family protein [Burkholderiales bacterium]|jgi:glutaredoxin|nr:glutaredoxin family protein [Burkholderiales bacterium]
MRTFSLFSATCVVVLLIAAMDADAQTLYRYTDPSGRVVYTDRPPLPSDQAKDVQMKQAGGNFIETDKMTAATRQAAERFPVTLYAFPCGEACESAEALLQKRGIPYSYVDIQTADGDSKLKKLTGKSVVPALQVGTDYISGFNEGTWNTKLNNGGYAEDAGVRTKSMYTKQAASQVQASAEPTDENGDTTLRRAQ